jgi:hypothetical protein
MTSRHLLTGGRRVAAAGRQLTADLGQRVAEVRCKLADFHADPPVTLDGDAAYLDEGTALHAVRGHRPNFRLAARRDGRLVLFEATTNARVRSRPRWRGAALRSCRLWSSLAHEVA